MFKRSAWIAASLWVVLGSEVAFAYDDVNGVIEKIDIPSRQLVLDGERTYPVARGILVPHQAALEQETGLRR